MVPSQSGFPECSAAHEEEPCLQPGHLPPHQPPMMMMRDQIKALLVAHFCPVFEGGFSKTVVLHGKHNLSKLWTPKHCFLHWMYVSMCTHVPMDREGVLYIYYVTPNFSITNSFGGVCLMPVGLFQSQIS